MASAAVPPPPGVHWPFSRTEPSVVISQTLPPASVTEPLPGVMAVCAGEPVGAADAGVSVVGVPGVAVGDVDTPATFHGGVVASPLSNDGSTGVPAGALAEPSSTVCAAAAPAPSASTVDASRSAFMLRPFPLKPADNGRSRPRSPFPADARTTVARSAERACPSGSRSPRQAAMPSAPRKPISGGEVAH